jgi:hypothetical protein
MTFGSLDTVYYTLTFLVPGVIATAIHSVFITRRDDQGRSAILRYLAFSALNFGIWSWAIYLVAGANALADCRWCAAAFWFVVTFVSPAVAGIALGYWTQCEKGRRLLQRLGLLPVHVIPTAWDWRFGRMAGAHWALVTLKDGTTVMGFFGGNSFASSSPAERDIYLEQLMHEVDGKWVLDTEGKGALITGSEIRMIEFWPTAPAIDDGGNQR